MSSEEATDGIQELYDRVLAILGDPEADAHVTELLSVYLQFEPEHGIAWLHFGDALRAVGRLREAEATLLKAADLAPENKRYLVYARIGMVVAKRASPSEAEKWYRAATSGAECPGWIWCLRGENLRRTDSHALARSCLETALRSEDVAKQEVFLNLALLERAQRRYDDARQYLNSALPLQPDYKQAQEALQSMAGIEETIEFAALAAEEVAEALERIFARALLLMSHQNTDVHLVELLSVYVKFKPEHGLAWFYLGDALITVGRLPEAEQALLKAVDLAPQPSSRFIVYASIAKLMTQRGSPAEAEKWFHIATAEVGCPGWVWVLRGVNLLNTEVYRLAKSCFETAMTCEDAPKDEVLLNLALLERAQRHYQEARKYADDACAMDPNYTDAQILFQSLAGIEETVDFAAQVAERAEHESRR